MVHVPSSLARRDVMRLVCECAGVFLVHSTDYSYMQNADQCARVRSCIDNAEEVD